jgi:trimeric autotransporter adhesin
MTNFIFGDDNDNTLLGDTLPSDLVDYIYGYAGNDSLAGLTENDTLDGGTGNDTLEGGTGDDLLIVGDGSSLVDGGDGIDTLQFDYQNATGGIVMLLDETTTNGTITAGANSISFTSIEKFNIRGTAFEDSIVGGNGDDTLYSNAGNDTLLGGIGNDNLQVEHSSGLTSLDGGQGDDVLDARGTFSFNTLNGGEGNDTLYGGLSRNTLIGGAGEDSFYISNSASANSLDGGDGNDWMQIRFTTGRNVLFGGIGSDTLDASSAFGVSVLNGGEGNDSLMGGLGRDVLDGGTGDDYMAGGANNDTYTVDSVGDTIVENANQGIDTVKSFISYTLSDNLDNLIVLATNAVFAGGNSLNNTITGNNIGSTLAGGGGNDLYIVTGNTDLIIEDFSQGIDTVRATGSYTLGANLENLTLLSRNAKVGRGNDLDNIITGNNSDNILDGGAGADTLVGGKGADTYLVDNLGDVVVELVGGGIDIVRSSVDYTLSDTLEKLTLLGTAVTGIGNSLNNIIIGNLSGNRLEGGAGNDSLDGSKGIDTLIGGLGNDTYVVDNIADVVIEGVGEGTDTIRAFINYTLISDDIENLALAGAAIRATGNSLNNVITGSVISNRLFGVDGNDTISGGYGNDTIFGGAGADFLKGDIGDDIINAGLGDGVTDRIGYKFGDGSDVVNDFVAGAGGDIIALTGISSVDVVINGSNTSLHLGDGISGNDGFGSGKLLMELVNAVLTPNTVSANITGAPIFFS